MEPSFHHHILRAVPSGVRVSVIIPTFNGVEFTRKCLTSLVAAGWNDHDELIIVDNASSDGTRDLLGTLDPAIRVVRNETNRNFAGACNQGVALARGRWVCLLNNDTEVTPGWLDAMVAEAETSGASIVGARLLYPDGRIQHGGVGIEPGAFPRHLFRFQPAATPHALTSFDCQAVTAACMLVDRELFVRVGGLDEEYRNGCEDLDLCFSAFYEHGARIRYCGAACITHHESVSPGRHEHDDANAERIAARWSGRMYSDRINGDRIVEVACPTLPRQLPAPIETSVIIPLHNRVDMTRACIESLRNTGLPASVEIILVDNASTDGTPAYLDEICGPIRCVRSDVNINFAGACNLGSRFALGHNFIFLNNDTVVTEGWLEPLVERLAEPGIGVAGARLLYPDGTIQHAGVAFDDSRVGFHINAGAPGDDPAVVHGRTMQAVTGACLAISRDVFGALMFDEGYRNGCEDLELCLQVAQRGLSIWYEPRSVVYHHESQSAGRFDHASTNLQRFLQRWHNAIVPDVATFDRAAQIAPGTYPYAAQHEPWVFRNAIRENELGATTDSVVLRVDSPGHVQQVVSALHPVHGRHLEIILVVHEVQHDAVRSAVAAAAFDSRADVHMSAHTASLPHQLNHALRMAAGEWIVFGSCDPASIPMITEAIQQRHAAVHEHDIVAVPQDARSASHGSQFIGTTNDGAAFLPQMVIAAGSGGEPALGWHRQLLDRMGGCTTRLTAAGPIIRDLVERGRIHGALTRLEGITSQQVWQTLQQWWTPTGPDAEAWASMWGRTPGRATCIEAPLHAPLVPQQGAADDVVAETRRTTILVPCDATHADEFGEVMDALVACINSRDDVTILVRTDGGIESAVAELERRTAHLTDDELPDIVLLNCGAGYDAALLQRADLVVCHGYSGMALHTPALLAGARPMNLASIHHLVKTTTQHRQAA